MHPMNAHASTTYKGKRLRFEYFSGKPSLVLSHALEITICICFANKARGLPWSSDICARAYNTIHACCCACNVSSSTHRSLISHESQKMFLPRTDSRSRKYIVSNRSYLMLPRNHLNMHLFISLTSAYPYKILEP